MNKLGLRITNNGREAYVANPNHDWELHTVDFNACLLALDNIDEGEGLLILSHGSGGCYVGMVHLLKQGFSGLCIAASIFVPENLAVDADTMRQLIEEVCGQLGGTMLDIAALDRLFATEYPEKDYVPAFEPQHGKSIAYRKEEWTDETLKLLLDSRCLFQSAYAQHKATLLIDAQSGIVCNGIDITDVPVVIPAPEPEPEIVEEPEVEIIEEPEPVEDAEPEVTILEDVSPGDGNGSEEVDNDGVEVIALSPEPDEQVDETESSDEGVEIVEPLEPIEIDGDTVSSGVVPLSEPDGSAEGDAKGEVAEGVEVVSVYPIPPNATVPPPPPVGELGGTGVFAPYGMMDCPINGSTPDAAYNANAIKEPPQNQNGNDPGASSRRFVTFLIFLLLGILLVFIVSASFSSKDKGSEERSAESSTSASVSDSYQLAEVSEAAEVNLNEKIYEAYVAKLESKAADVGADDEGFCEYFLHDITGDDIPELWVRCGTCEADFMLYVYRYGVGQLELMYSTGAGHSSFYCGAGYVIQMVSHMGYSEWYRLTLSGSSLNEEMVFEESDVYDYTVPDEPEADVYDYDETWPIYGALKL